MRKSIQIIIIIILVFAVLVFGVSAYVAASASEKIAGTDDGGGIDRAIIDESGSIDPQCILVLGCAVWEDDQPSPMLRDRLDTAIELYRQGAAPKLLLSGDNSVKEYSEPDCMFKYALDQGVPAEDVFLDFAGFSTYDSIYRANAVFKADSMIVVTQKYHLYRALNICDRLGIKAVGVASDQQKYAGRFNREAREVLARDKDLIKGIMKPEPTFLGDEIPISGDGRVTHVNAAYTLDSSHEVDGRQGIAWENGRYYVSGSTTVSVYDQEWNRIKTETDPFTDFDAEVNHIGDIDVYNGEIYASVEYFMDGEASNIQIAVYDTETLKLTRTYMFDSGSGQTEVSGITVDSDHGSIWMCSWTEDESGSYLYRYDLASGEYTSKVHMSEPPQLIQGIVYRDGWIYITADDGSADDDEPDHVYKCWVDPDLDEFQVYTEKTLDDVTRQGEIEGISFDKDRNQMLISYNRGAIIVKGMPKGFYDGYDEEIHEVFIYSY